jgi:hypothetical protein
LSGARESARFVAGCRATQAIYVVVLRIKDDQPEMAKQWRYNRRSTDMEGDSMVSSTTYKIPDQIA